MTRTATVVVASTRAAGGLYPDRTGPIIAAWLHERGFSVTGPLVVLDGDAVGDALHAALQSASDLVITTGGTGLSPTDATPQQTARLLDYEIPGLGEEIRRVGVATTPTAVLSRGLAGVAGRSLIVNLPGSPGGVRDGLSVLDGVWAHALDQIVGVDHDSGAGERP